MPPRDDGMAAGYSNDEILGSYTIEDRFSEYFDLIRPEWWQNFAGAIEKAPEIRDAGNDLLVQWRSATRVADFPAAMMVMFNQFADTTLKSQMPSDMAPMLAEAWGKAFRAHAPKLADGTLFNTAIRATKESFGRRMATVNRDTIRELSGEQIWQSYAALKEFRFRVWSTMNVSTVAAYNAYDGFLKRCTHNAPGDGLKERLKARFGATMYVRLFQHPDIQIAREVRHAISHNRARVTRKLENLRPGLQVHDGLISVYPCDMRRFLSAMGDAAMDLARSLAAAQ